MIDSMDLNVPRGTFELLVQYCQELLKWNSAINLVSKRSGAEVELIMERHVMDCLQLLPYLHEDGDVLDIGSGAGLPGMVLAIGGMKKVFLIEPDQKKGAFLRYVAAKLKVECKVVTLGMEEYKHHGVVRVITSRAFASCYKIIAGCAHNIDDNTRLILLKSVNQVDCEIDELSVRYDFNLQIEKSKVNNEGRILIFSDVKLKNANHRCS